MYEELRECKEKKSEYYESYQKCKKKYKELILDEEHMGELYEKWSAKKMKWKRKTKECRADKDMANYWRKSLKRRYRSGKIRQKAKD